MYSWLIFRIFGIGVMDPKGETKMKGLERAQEYNEMSQ